MVPLPTEPDNGGPQISIPTQTGRVALLWTSIGAAVFTSLIQGLITTIVQVAEDQSLWTFRFRIARFEHWWWTTVSVLLSISFALIILTFLAGNSQDAVGVLALSTATTIAIGLTLIPPKGLWEDPTAVLEKFGEDKDAYRWPKLDAPCVYDDGDIGDGDISLRWGEDQGFRRRVSRAINAMPAGLLTSYPTTTDGYKGEGLCLAYGILGRNKGLRPNELRFDASDSWKKSRGIRRNRENTPVRAVLENSSSHGAGPDSAGHEAERAPHVAKRSVRAAGHGPTPAMIISLNYYLPLGRIRHNPLSVKTAVRPDLTCFALLYPAEHAVSWDADAGVVAAHLGAGQASA
ncbi:hypothetical protein E4U42_002288 [Claviceps africana]|uniref:Uncharacterized protein n=1 Tax=Claviceps africana TaxID=83212 RepID=A0A8K0NIR2_9HYPO|nr:hypothetical protein E4U42_002288 [Claviceps africana]